MGLPEAFWAWAAAVGSLAGWRHAYQPL